MLILKSNVVLSHQYDNYDASVDANDDITLISTYNSYESEIDTRKHTIALQKIIRKNLLLTLI